MEAFVWIVSLIVLGYGVQSQLHSQPEIQQINAVKNLYRFSDDPEAANDLFPVMPSNHKSIWKSNYASKFSDLKSDLRSTKVQIVIDVILVGFDGVGAESVKIERLVLLRHLEKLNADIHIQSMGFPDAKPTDPNEGIGVSIQFNVYMSQKTVAVEIQKAISAELQNAESSVDLASEQYPGLRTISYKVVDDILKEDYKRGKFLPAIYILNPAVKTSSPYAYSYLNKSSCPGSFWVSSGAETSKRYIWIDLSAGPLSYGSYRTGHGLVMEHSFPRVLNYSPKIQNTAIIPDLAATINSAVQHLLVPQTMSLNLPRWKRLTLNVVHFHDTFIAHSYKEHSDELTETLMQLTGSVFRGHTIEVKHHSVPLGVCDACTAAFNEYTHVEPLFVDPCSTRALMIETKKHPTEDQVEEREFLDPDVIHGWLSDPRVRESITDDFGKHILPKSTDPDDLIVPVFLFEMATQMPLSFQGGNIAVSFSDMVLGVRTHGGEFTTDMTCAKQLIKISPSRIARPILAAVLQTVWGIMDPSTILSSTRNPLYDYRWSVGATPFGHLSSESDLPILTRQIGRRNLVLSSAWQVINKTLIIYEILESISQTGSPADIFAKKELEEFYSRANLVRSKIATALIHVGKDDFDLAAYYVKSCQHEITAFTKLMDGLPTSGLQSVMVCFHERAGLNLFLLAAIGAALATVFRLLRRFRRVKTKVI